MTNPNIMTDASTCPNCRHPLSLPAQGLVIHTDSLFQSNDCFDGSRDDVALADARHEIMRINTEIERLGGLIEQRVKLEKFVAEQEALSAPVRRIPPEIMAAIFTFCLPDVSQAKKPDLHRPSDAPFLLAQVSRQWRDIALSTPQLWATIAVSDKRSLKHAVWLAETFLARSGQFPLSLTVAFGYNDCASLLQTIIPHSERWRSVSFTMPASMHVALAPVRGRLSCLESLTLNCSRNDIIPNLPLNTYEVAPRLTAAAVDFPSASGSVLRLPWSQLTRWSGRTTVEDCIAVTRDASNLISSSFILRRPLCMTDISIPPHHFLSSLHLRILDFHFPSILLPLLTLPALRELSVTGPNIPLDSFTAFLSRSPHLASLSVQVQHLTDNDLIKCLRHAPSVVDLTVYADYRIPLVTDQLLRRLTYQPNNTNACLLLPRLEVLRFMSYLQFNELSLVPMVLSRMKGAKSGAPVAALRSLQFHELRKKLDPDLAAGVDTLKATGLDVHVSVQYARQ